MTEDGGKVRLRVEALSAQRLTSVEVIVNGRVAATLPESGPYRVVGTVELDIARGSWIAVRCTARDELLTDEELSVYRQGQDSEAYRIRPSRLRFAHTSPIYVTVGGRQAGVEESIKEGLQMLDRFEVFAGENADAEYRAAIIEAVREARARLAARIHVK